MNPYLLAWFLLRSTPAGCIALGMGTSPLLMWGLICFNWIDL